MPITRTYINTSIEFLEGSFDDARMSQLALLRRLYNPTLGPVTALKLHRPGCLDLPIYATSCNHSPVNGLIRDVAARAAIDESILVPGGGKGIRFLEAILGGLGEISERLLAVLDFEALSSQLIAARYSDIRSAGKRALGPDELPLFSAEQYRSRGFPYSPFRPDAMLRWIDGYDLLTGDEILVPAQLVMMYYRRLRGEPLIGYPTTGGLSFHHDRRTAIVHAVCEIVERDAINVRWYSRLAPSRVTIDIPMVIGEGDRTSNRAFSTPYMDQVEIYLNTLDVPVPVFTAIAIDGALHERAFLGGGGASHVSVVALKQALFELAQSRMSLRVYRNSPAKNIRPASEVSVMDDFFDAALYYGFGSNHAKLDWYRHGGFQLDWKLAERYGHGNGGDDYDIMLQWVRDLGLSPVIVDFGKNWPGIELIKVIIPQLTQAAVPSHPYFGHPRYYQLPAQLQLAPGMLSFSDLNPDPLPFP